VVGIGSAPLLTVAPGVTLRFAKDARLLLDAASGTATGAIHAEGTAVEPIVLESAAAAPAAGDWVGIVIKGTPDARDKIKSATIAHAGGASQISSFDCPGPSSTSFADEGAIVMAGGQPASGRVRLGFACSSISARLATRERRGTWRASTSRRPAPWWSC
jgi:hypothetical protein